MLFLYFPTVMYYSESTKVWISEPTRKHNVMHTNFQDFICYCLLCPFIPISQHVTANSIYIKVVLQLNCSAYYSKPSSDRRRSGGCVGDRMNYCNTFFLVLLLNWGIWCQQIQNCRYSICDWKLSLFTKIIKKNFILLAQGVI